MDGSSGSAPRGDVDGREGGGCGVGHGNIVGVDHFTPFVQWQFTGSVSLVSVG